MSLPVCLCPVLLQVFISFITATANDVCKEKKRSTINADDVFQALEDVEFADLLPALKKSYEGVCFAVLLSCAAALMTGTCVHLCLGCQAQGQSARTAWTYLRMDPDSSATWPERPHAVVYQRGCSTQCHTRCMAHCMQLQMSCTQPAFLSAIRLPLHTNSLPGPASAVLSCSLQAKQ